MNTQSQCTLHHSILISVKLFFGMNVLTWMDYLLQIILHLVATPGEGQASGSGVDIDRILSQHLLMAFRRLSLSCASSKFSTWIPRVLEFSYMLQPGLDEAQCQYAGACLENLCVLSESVYRCRERACMRWPHLGIKNLKDLREPGGAEKELGLRWAPRLGLNEGIWLRVCMMKEFVVGSCRKNRKLSLLWPSNTKAITQFDCN